jgi:hypothetical protein
LSLCVCSTSTNMLKSAGKFSVFKELRGCPRTIQSHLFKD